MNSTLNQWLTGQIDDLKLNSLYKEQLVLESPCNSRITINGKSGIINLASNNYLGLANHRDLVAAACEAAQNWGAGAGAVRPITGTLQIHVDLEKQLAAFKHTEAALVFQSGFTSNAGVIPTITDGNDVILTDELNHASIIDGVRLSKAQRKIYKHCDLRSLEEGLQASTAASKRLIITDGVFSMDGDIAPLPGIVELARRYDAAVMVDDAHGSGVMGGGRGTAYHFGVHHDVDIQLGTLSKAVGVMGGYIAGSRPLIDWLTQRARPFLFSTAQPAPVVAAIMAAIRLMDRDSSLTDKLWENAAFWKSGLQGLGFDTGVSQTPITPVMIGDEAVAMKFQHELLNEGVLALAIVYPTVAQGKARIRTMPSAMHSREDLIDALGAFKRAAATVGLL